MGMRLGGYFIIISHYFMTSLNLVKISNTYTKIQILWLLLEMILNRSLAVIIILNCSVAEIYEI